VYQLQVNFLKKSFFKKIFERRKCINVERFCFLLNSCTLRKKNYFLPFFRVRYTTLRHEHARQDFKAPVAGGRHLPGYGRGGPPRRLGSAGGQGPGKFL